MMRLLTKIAATTCAAALICATPALADPITLDASDVGTSFSLDYDGFSGSTVIPGLGATTTFTLTGVTGTSYTFDYVVANTSGSGLDSRVSSFAFDTDPDIASATSTGTYNYTVLDSNYPNGIGNVDVCFKAGGSNSCAGNSGGVYAGDTGMGSLTLNFSQPIGSLTLDNFFVRYQSITGAGLISSASGKVVGDPGTPVPEPETLALFALSLAAVALRRRRKPARTVQASIAYA